MSPLASTHQVHVGNVDDMGTGDIGRSLRQAVRWNADSIAVRTLTADGQRIATEASLPSTVRGCHDLQETPGRQPLVHVRSAVIVAGCKPCLQSFMSFALYSGQADELGGAGQGSWLVVEISGACASAGTRRSFGRAWAKQRRIPAGELRGMAALKQRSSHVNLVSFLPPA